MSFRRGIGRGRGYPRKKEEEHPPSGGGGGVGCDAVSDSFETASMSSSQSFYSCSSKSSYHLCPENGHPEKVNSIVSASTTFHDYSSSSSGTTPSLSTRSESAPALQTEDNETVIDQGRDEFVDFFTTMSIKMNAGRGIDGIMRVLPPGIPIWVTVVKVLEPAYVLVQLAKQAEMVESLKAQLKGSYLRKMCREDTFEGVFVAIKHQDEYYRAQIEKVDSFSQQCWVRLVDVGSSLLKPLREIYELPNPFLAIQRQLFSAEIGDIRPTDSRKLFNHLRSHLVGKRVQLEITHFYQECHYFVSSVRVAGEENPLSNVLIEKGLALAAKTVDREAEPLIRPEFPKYKTPYLNIGEVIDDVWITNVVSPKEFYVRKRQSNDLDKARINHILRDTSNASLGFYRGMYSDGTRMCICTLNPITNEEGIFRAFCQNIDFTEEPAQATVFLVDLGITCKIPLETLSEYARILGEHPAQAYRVSIDAKPVNNEWSAEATECLKDIMNLSQRGAPVRITCVRKGKSYVKMQLNCCDMDWTQALQKIGEIRNPAKQAAVNAHDLGKIMMPMSTYEFSKYQRIGSSFITNRGDQGEDNVSPYSFARIPPAELPSVGELLKIKRLKGVYLYLVMTKRCYDLYQELKKHCLEMVTSGKAEMEGHVFTVGDVVLAPWNPITYQRCVITALEDRDEVMCAKVMAFDIEQTQSFQVTKLKRPDDFVMKTEKLCHVVWLEGMNENTLVLSQDFSNFIKSYSEWVTLTKFETLPSNKLVVRFAITDCQGATVSLAKEVEGLARWNWEKYFNAGFLSQQRLLKKLDEITPFTLNLQKFLYEGENEVVKGLCKVQIRRLEVTQDPNLLYIMVILQNESVTDDFRALRWQMNRLYDKVRYAQPLENSTTYPNLVALREIHDVFVKGKLGSPCMWHRSVFSFEKKRFQCVDCFELHEVGKIDGELSSLAQTRGWDIREICPEMLRVLPFGKRLAVNLLHTDRYVKALINELLKPGRDIEVRIKRPIAQQPSDNRELTGSLTADVPEITNRLKKVLEAIRTKENVSKSLE